MSVTATIIRRDAPEFATLTDEIINAFIAYAEQYVDETQFGDAYDHAMSLMTCHLLTLRDRSGASGTIESESLGDAARTYAIPTTGVGALDSTSYGSQFKYSAESKIVNMMVIT
jgi:hypothetical protein